MDCSIEKKSKEIKKDAEKAAKKIESIAKEKADFAKKKLNDAAGEIKELENKAKNYVKENPEKSILAAAGIGALFGAIASKLTGKGKKKKKK